MFGKNTQAIVLAAGRSSRFQRTKSKLLTKICGQAIALFPLKVLEELQISTTVVLGYQADQVKEEIEQAGIKNVTYALQEERLGTGHAVLCSKDSWKQENILILNGDVPLLTVELIEVLLNKHIASDAALSFVSTYVMDPSQYGRVVEQDGKICIYEEKDCPPKFYDENKVNAGIYVAKRSFLEKYLSKIEKSSESGEFYITDLVGVASDQELGLQVVSAPFDCVRGVNTLQELWAVEQVMRSNLIKYWMSNGVRFEMAQNTHIDIDVEIGADSVIGAGGHLLGQTKIGKGCSIGPFTILENAIIGDRSSVHSHSVIKDSQLGKEVEVGPFAHLRNNAILDDKSSIGNFVEVKNSSIGRQSKAKHLSYIGDATLGAQVNIGAGTVFCNYDGSQKHKTVIADEVFIGSNNTLVAPLMIEKGAYVAAGSTITKDIASNDLAVGRARQENKKGYALKFKQKKKKIAPANSESLSKKSCVPRKKESKLKFHFLGATRMYVQTKEGI